ncbi:transposase [Vibrio cholerae]|nr:transposase DDE domain protein [Vibrio cholerae]GHY76109.1 transposase [Vibrio cholerae]
MAKVKHGTDGKRRVWRKLHLAVDTSTHEIVSAELSLSNVTDAEVLPNLLKQTRRRIIEISGDGAYDTRVATMLYGSSELFHSSLQEKGQPSGRMVRTVSLAYLAVDYQKLYGSYNKWKRRYGYHKRSLSETAMYQVRPYFGG